MVDVDILDGDNLRDHCVIACNVSVQNVGALFVGYDRENLYTYTWSSDAKQRYYFKTGCALHKWLDCYKKQLGCRYLAGMCDDASHGGVINAAYESLVDRLRACSKDIYVKK